MKKMLLPMLAMLALLAAPLIAWGGPPMLPGSGTVSSKDFTVAGFDTVSLKGIPGFRITAGDTPAVTVTTDGNIADHVMVNVYGTRLEVSMDPAYSYRPTSFELVITLPRIAAAAIYDSRGSIDKFSADAVRLDLYGRSAVDASELDANSLALNATDTSSITGRINGYRTMVSLHGKAKAALSGDSDSLVLNADGGAADFGGLDASRAWVSLSNGASARINGNHGIGVSGFVRDGATLKYTGKADVGGVFVGESGSLVAG